MRKTQDRIFFVKYRETAYIGQFVVNETYSYICFGVIPVL